MVLAAESIEELQAMLRVCEVWAADVGLDFNVPKCKTMVLAGPYIICNDLSQQQLSLSNQSLGGMGGEVQVPGLPSLCF